MKSEILRLLKESDDYISGQQMCDRFHVSRTAVWKAIEQLKKEGYEIEAVRNRGYRLLESPDIMSEAEIRSLMDTEWAGKNIVYFDEIDSTNNRAKELGEKDGVDGTLFVADRQVAGKREKIPCVGIPKRNQHLYDNSAPTRSDTDKGTDADISYGTECGRRYPGSDRHGDWNQMAERYCYE